jgi:hypothetical protein
MKQALIQNKKEMLVIMQKHARSKCASSPLLRAGFCIFDKPFKLVLVLYARSICQYSQSKS